jgi:hypothetical protein
MAVGRAAMMPAILFLRKFLDFRTKQEQNAFRQMGRAS